MASNNGIKVIANNRKARHDYHIEDTYEAGIVLTGSEIKSVRAAQVSLRDSYVSIRNGEMWLVSTHIAPYEQASRENHEPRRDRKLLMHRREIDRLTSKLQERGFTLIPTRMYLKHGRAKVELGLARGKKSYDKRETLRERDDNRRIQRALNRRRKGH